MSHRLVIPTGAQATDVAWPGTRPETWQQIAADNGCDAVEVLGSQWCIDNHIGGLGIATEYVAPVIVVPDPNYVDPNAAAALVRLIDQSGAQTIADLRAAAAEATGVA